MMEDNREHNATRFHSSRVIFAKDDAHVLASELVLLADGEFLPGRERVSIKLLHSIEYEYTDWQSKYRYQCDTKLGTAGCQSFV